MKPVAPVNAGGGKEAPRPFISSLALAACSGASRADPNRRVMTDTRLLTSASRPDDHPTPNRSEPLSPTGGEEQENQRFVLPKPARAAKGSERLIMPKLSLA